MIKPSRTGCIRAASFAWLIRCLGSAGSGFAAWIELALLRRWLAGRIGAVPIPTKLLVGTLICALAAGGAGYGAAELALHLGARGWQSALVAIPVFGGVYLGIAAIAQIPEANAFTRRLLRRR